MFILKINFLFISYISILSSLFLHFFVSFPLGIFVSFFLSFFTSPLYFLSIISVCLPLQTFISSFSPSLLLPPSLSHPSLSLSSLSLLSFFVFLSSLTYSPSLPLSYLSCGWWVLSCCDSNWRCHSYRHYGGTHVRTSSFPYYLLFSTFLRFFFLFLFLVSFFT